jgi:hypothetical protein
MTAGAWMAGGRSYVLLDSFEWGAPAGPQHGPLGDRDIETSREALAEFERAGLQNVDPDYAAALFNIGVVFSARGQPGLQEPWSRAAVAAMDEIQGVNHPRSRRYRR